jgi:hypothetical protein
VFAVFCAPYIVMMLFVNAIDFFFISFFSELFLAFFLYTLWEERRRMIRKALLVSLFFQCFVYNFVALFLLLFTSMDGGCFSL